MDCTPRSSATPKLEKTCSRILHLRTIAQSGSRAFNSIAHVFDPPNASRSHERRPRLPQAGAVTRAVRSLRQGDPRQARGYLIQPDTSFNHAQSTLAGDVQGEVFALSSA